MPTIRKRGDKWQAQIRRAGHQNLSRTFLTKKDAQAWARYKELQADKGELPHTVDREILKNTSLGELVERYRDEVCPEKRGVRVETIILNAFLRHPLSQYKLSEITTHCFVAYRDERLKVIKPNTLRRQLAPLHNLFEVARSEWGYPIDENPIANLRLANVDTKRERRLRDGEWERLVAAARTRKNPFVLPIMRFALATAMRRGEILAMRWEHLDRANRTLLIPTTKTGHARTIPLSPEALSVLDQVSSLDTTTEAFPITDNAFRLSWQRIQKLAEVHDFRFHDLRHEAISRFFEMGLSVPEVALISGHRDARMLFRYTHPLCEQITTKLYG